MSRFHNKVYFEVDLRFGVTPKKEVIIEGFWVDAMMLGFEPREDGPYIIKTGDSDNNGVTLAHILSELASS